MLIRTLYVSRSVGPQTSTVTAQILATAQSKNKENVITGVLCQGQGLYLQVLEGERTAVQSLYARLVADRRHRDVQMLQLEFDPYSAPGALVAGLVDELVARGTRLTVPAA